MIQAGNCAHEGVYSVLPVGRPGRLPYFTATERLQRPGGAGSFGAKNVKAINHKSAKRQIGTRAAELTLGVSFNQSPPLRLKRAHGP